MLRSGSSLLDPARLRDWRAGYRNKARTLTRRLIAIVSLCRPTGLTRMSLRDRYPYDIAAVLNLRLLGVRVVNGRLRARTGFVVAVSVLTLLPIGLAVVWQLLWPGPSGLVGPHLWWHVYFVALIVLTFLSSWAGCKTFYALTSDLEDALTPEGIAEYHRWAERRTRLRPQLASAAAFSLLAMAALAVASNVPGMSKRLYVNASSYLSVFITAFIVAGGVYWIWHGTGLAYRLTRPGRMQLMWAAPARTPGVESLARCYRLSFYLAALGSAACLIPLLYWAYRGPPSQWLWAAKSILLVASLLSTAAIAVLPQWWLSEAVGLARRATLTTLRGRLPDTADEVNLSDRDLSTLQGLIKLASDSPQTTVSDRTIAALILGISLALAPNVIPFIR